MALTSINSLAVGRSQSPPRRSARRKRCSTHPPVGARNDIVVDSLDPWRDVDCRARCQAAHLVDGEGPVHGLDDVAAHAEVAQDRLGFETDIP